MGDVENEKNVKNGMMIGREFKIRKKRIFNRRGRKRMEIKLDDGLRSLRKKMKERSVG